MENLVKYYKMNGSLHSKLCERHAHSNTLPLDLNSKISLMEHS